MKTIINGYHAQFDAKVDAEPICGPLKSLPPISLKLVSQTESEPLWDRLVSRYHYLGYQNLLGRRLKYLCFIQDRPVSALSWSAPALKLRVRDHFIGWSHLQRKEYLHRIANNSRFLILPWVRVPHLASHVLSHNIRRLKKDWPERFNHPLWMLETFVDPRYFKGTSYKAANWNFLGHTHGSSKQGQTYFYHGNIKEVYFYGLVPDFRDHIGCQQTVSAFFNRPPQTSKKVEELKMILRHADWNPDLFPWMDLTEQDLENIAGALVHFHQEFHDCLGRIENRRLGLAYFSGLMSNSKAKSIEPIALEFLGEKAVRSEQRFMKSYRWDQEAMGTQHQTMLSHRISAPGGMITVDSSEFPKKGTESVGVARQYCGRIGKVENCQSGVFVGYTSEKGYGLLTGRLYMPQCWFSDEYKDRRKANLVPKDLIFKTKPKIAGELINDLVNTHLFQAKWVGCDATFGSDLDFLKSLPKELSYFASIRSDTKVFLQKTKVGLPPYKGRGPRPKKMKVLPGQPHAQTLAEVAKSDRCTWTPMVLAEGAKGPVVAEVTRLRVYRSHDGIPQGRSLWLFMRRMADGQIKYAFSNAPHDIPLEEMGKASTMRWPIEQCFQDGKSQLGMDQYEHRSWPAWHRHMTYVFLAMHFLLGLRIEYKKNSRLNIASGSQTGCCNVTFKIPQLEGSPGNREIPYLAESSRLLVPCEKKSAEGKIAGIEMLKLKVSL